MTRIALLPSTILFAAALTLGACEQKDNAALEKLDQSLTGNQTDPALAAALEDQIVVDPKGKAGGQAGAAAGAPGTLLRAPKPVKAAACTGDCAAETGRKTLGGLAQQQAKRGCDAKLDYGNGWAERLPADMPLYPNARVVEAAGMAGKMCNIRIVTFTTGAPLQNVIDFYYTKAVRAGFSAEHLLDGTDNVLGGTRAKDDGAYYVMARAVKGGTEVDLMANNGR